jgi:hypothetical protein
MLTLPVGRSSRPKTRQIWLVFQGGCGLFSAAAGFEAVFLFATAGFGVSDVTYTWFAVLM